MNNSAKHSMHIFWVSNHPGYLKRRKKPEINLQQALLYKLEKDMMSTPHELE